jgi:hypothetical protein
MNLLSDIISYVRRIIKSPSNAVITDNLIIDYINRFWLMDVDARIQLFDLKTKYQFQTTPGVDQYNMPLYNLQIEGNNPISSINYYPVYQGFISPAFINGIQVPMQSEQNSFYNIWPNIVQQLPVVAVGDGGSTYTFTFPIVANFNTPPNPPLNGILRGHVDLTGIIDFAGALGGSFIDPPVVTSLQAQTTIPAVPTTSVDAKVWITSTDAAGANVVVTDSGQFLSGSVNYGLLMKPGSAPNGNLPLGPYSTIENTINYFSGTVNVTFPVPIPEGNNINAQCFFFQSGLPRGILYYDNSLILRSPPDQQYLVELTAYLSPSAYLNSSSAVQFAYMAEYIARGAARKILSDTGDIEQFQFYEPLFKEQETLVWKRSQRQFTNTRTGTIYSEGINQGQSGFNNLGGSVL